MMQDLRYALRQLQEDSGIYADGCGYAGAGDQGGYGDLYCVRSGATADAAG